MEAEAQESAELFRRFFAGWHFARLEGADVPEPDATIQVCAGTPPRAPAGLESFETAVGGICRTDGRTYIFERDGSAVRAEGHGRGVEVKVWVGRRAASRETSALARLVFEATMAALRRCGLFELHAAGTVEPRTGGGFLVVGPSGSGKSTLATQLARAGWRYLSDDALLLRAGADAVEACALRREFAVTEQTVAAGVLEGFEDSLREPTAFDPLKRRFKPHAVFPEGFAESCAPRALFFPVITNEPASRARRLTQAETMRGLLRMCPWACYDRPAAAAHLGLLARLARQAAGFELHAGRDLLGDASRSADYLRRLAERASV
ncbi:MAG TPA: hypothetical protein VN282_16170 [Pyrinomonadaceae bacterium]|nr:hypothetical protein [Pyrinomonadaceae bacterium]